MLRTPRLWKPGRSSLKEGFSSFPHISDITALAGAVRRCGRTGAHGSGGSLHCLLVKNGLCRNTFLANNLMVMYVDLGCFGKAQNVFEGMPHRNVISWTTSISAHCTAGNPSQALANCTWMLNSEMEELPNCYAFSAALKACALAGDIDLGRWIHRRVIEAAIGSDTVLMNALLDMYIKCKSLREAKRLFDEIPEANTTSWNTMIDGYIKEDAIDEAEKMFLELPVPDAISFNTIIAGFAQKGHPKSLQYLRLMYRKGFDPDFFTFPSVLRMCGSQRLEEEGWMIHCGLVKSGLHTSHCGSALVSMYASCGSTREAVKVFEEYTCQRESLSYVLAISNAMVSGFVANGCNRSALRLISLLHSRGMDLDAYTLSCALKACTNLNHLRLASQIHALITHYGLHFDLIVGSVLMEFYVNCGNLPYALGLFNALPQKDVITCAGLIDGCMQQGLHRLAFFLYRDMINLGIKIDEFIMSSLLKAFINMSELEGGRQVHAQSIKSGLEGEKVMVCSLVDMYSKSGVIDDALQVFKTATHRDTVCWTVIIVGCAINGRAKEAISLFQEMVGLDAEPNEVTFLGALSACRHAGWVERACQLFNSITENYGMVPCLEHYCCLVDILSRAGLMREAQKLIAEMPYQPDENVWNSLIGAYGIHGNGMLEFHPEYVLPCNTSVHITLSNTCASLGMWEYSIHVREETKRLRMKDAGVSWLRLRGEQAKYLETR